MFIFLFNLVAINIWWSILMIVPTYVDGMSQLLFKRESNNILRVTTGILAGIGVMSVISILGKFIAAQILLLFK